METIDPPIKLGALVFLTKTDIAPNRTSIFPIGTKFAGRLASRCKVGEKIRFVELNALSVTNEVTEIILEENNSYTIKTKTATYTLEIIEDADDQFNDCVQKTKELHGMI